MKPISEQVVVITGASSGIGLVTARAFAERGAKVVLAARNEADLERETGEVRRRYAAEAIAVPADVTDYRQVEALAQRAVQEFGRIDTWVNNAGVTAYATFEEMPLDDFRQIIEINFMGQVHGAKAALPHLERTGGALICVGSTLSDRGVPLQSAYCASKHAIKGWLDSLRVELMKKGSPVRVTLVKPSSIDTPLFTKAKTQLGVKPQPIPPIYAPELAAEAILRAAGGNERDVFVGGGGKALSVAERISPKLVDRQMLKQGFDGQETDEPKSVDAPHNLYAPVAHDGGATGDFTARATDRSLYQSVAAHPVASSLAASALLGAGALGLRKMSGSKALPLLLGAAALMLRGKGVLAATGQE